ncbi:hypothetical protein CCAX7_32130 [Capsulimonas corticalis]|uniref:Uncharacterized protein n=1 Tax=Capsulimonas corticalis TaxID=2219043 RepID=A0A402D445_9BACT|nr:ferritin-like domain-containing protein [Capsulimonas corticalis]BDI31162.1 hypothetical protein CCAX7_32130 [Capsulimonas corticalis]
MSFDLSLKAPDTDALPHDRPKDQAAPGTDPVVDIERWLSHFRGNQEHRLEPEWDAPITLPPGVIKPLLRSLEQFELGDGGGPDRLIARNADSFRCETTAREALVDMWFVEEKEHSRLLGGLVRRFGGRSIQGHWSFSAFCLSRQVLGVGFELSILLVTEIVSTAYYRLLCHHGDDAALKGVCRLILRDEAGHVAFHRDRMARTQGRTYGPLWEMGFRLLAMGAATMLYINHAPALTAVGAGGSDFYREVRHELALFLRRLRTEAAEYREAVHQGQGA